VEKEQGGLGQAQWLGVTVLQTLSLGVRFMQMYYRQNMAVLVGNNTLK